MPGLLDTPEFATFLRKCDPESALYGFMASLEGNAILVRKRLESAMNELRTFDSHHDQPFANNLSRRQLAAYNDHKKEEALLRHPR